MRLSNKLRKLLFPIDELYLGDVDDKKAKILDIYCLSDDPEYQKIEVIRVDTDVRELYVPKAIQRFRDNGIIFSRWIPVSERLPELRKCVLVCNDLDIYIGILDKDEQWHSVDAGFMLRDINAWMPLPEPYKECKE